MAELIGIFDQTLAANRDEWGKIFDEAGLIWGPVMGLHEVPQDPHAQELGMFPTIEHPELGTHTVNIPMRFVADVNLRACPAAWPTQRASFTRLRYGRRCYRRAAGRWHGEQKPVAVDIEALLALRAASTAKKQRQIRPISLTLGIPYWIPTEPGAGLGRGDFGAGKSAGRFLTLSAPVEQGTSVLVTRLSQATFDQLKPANRNRISA